MHQHVLCMFVRGGDAIPIAILQPRIRQILTVIKPSEDREIIFAACPLAIIQSIQIPSSLYLLG